MHTESVQRGVQEAALLFQVSSSITGPLKCSRRKDYKDFLGTPSPVGRAGESQNTPVGKDWV